MTRRHIHYEAAFEDYLRRRSQPYVAVDDAKKAVFSGASIKSFDFLVYSSGPTNWLADVKGRKLALRSARGKGHLENWTTRDDIVGLGQWASVFGSGFAGLLVFVYWLTSPQLGIPFPGTPHEHGGRHYALAGMEACRYAECLRDRSRRWGTVSVPARVFRSHVRPIGDFL